MRTGGGPAVQRAGRTGKDPVGQRSPACGGVVENSGGSSREHPFPSVWGSLVENVLLGITHNHSVLFSRLVCFTSPLAPRPAHRQHYQQITDVLGLGATSV